ncbi:MAG: tetratricopeptide repeat protein [Methylococcales bacterium]|nr:tetratricopeptide repeat protein [Methylococcales bacterium]MDP3838828.1 tetratricopeptide repeat protein [Methylococcales bacterium]
MKKLILICLFLAVIVGGGWGVHFYNHLKPKADNIGVGYSIAEGNDFLNIGRYDEAKKLFASALATDPKNVKAAWGLKLTEAKETSSINAFKLAIDALYEQNSNDAYVNLFLGEFFLAINQLDKARPYLQQALNQNPKLAEAHFHLASLHEEQGNFATAKSEISLAIDISRSPKYRNKLAHIYIKLHHLDAATAEYEKSVDYPLSALDVAEIYWQRDRFDLALIRQLQAVKWLNDTTVMALPENKDSWTFKISDEEKIALNKLDEKLNYAYLCLSFTLYFLDNTEESERYVQEARNLSILRHNDVNTLVTTRLDTLVQEKYGSATKVEVFKAKYLVNAITP